MSTTRIAFAACSKFKSDPTQEVWDELLAQDPEHLMLLGDQIYMDYSGEGSSTIPGTEFIGYDLGDPAKLAPGVFEKQMRLRYQMQFGVRAFRQCIHHIGSVKNGTVDMVWDDHDFGFNNSLGLTGGGSDAANVSKIIAPALKTISRRLFEEFRLNVLNLRTSLAATYTSLDSAWLPNASEGPPPGVQKRYVVGGVPVFLLDTRSFRQSPTPRDAPGPAAMILGAAQWQWLSTALLQDTSRLSIIASGSPLTSPGAFADQSWKQAEENMRPYLEHDQLFALAQMLREQQRRLLFVGGDRHAADMIDKDGVLPEVVCAGSAAPKPVLPDGRHFCIADADSQGPCRIRLFTRGKCKKKDDHALFSAAA